MSCRGFSVPPGEAWGVGLLGLKVLYSSSIDFLVTRTWMTLSPFELPTVFRLNPSIMAETIPDSLGYNEE